MRVLVYSAIFGDYDPVKDFPKQSIPCDFQLFTESKGQKTPRLDSRWYKLNPPAGYDYTIWIDGSIRVTSRFFAEYMVDQARDRWAMFKHPWRDCIYKEAEESHDMRKYHNEPIMAQAEAYRKAGMPTNWGLWASGIICRRNDWGDDLNQLWWAEHQKWSVQDQISLPYVLWKYKLQFFNCDLALYDNPLCRVEANHRVAEYEKCPQS
jgi:hypothetical protein